jgi:hypothetical protein
MTAVTLLVTRRPFQEKAAAGCTCFAGGGYADGGEIVDRAFVLAQTASDT